MATFHLNNVIAEAQQRARLWTTRTGEVMKTLTAVIFALELAACAATTKDGTPINVVENGALNVGELFAPGSTHKRREADDDARCRQFGFKPGTDAYGNCRLQRDQLRATREAADAARAGAAASGPQTCQLIGNIVQCY